MTEQLRKCTYTDKNIHEKNEMKSEVAAACSDDKWYCEICEEEKLI